MGYLRYISTSSLIFKDLVIEIEYILELGIGFLVVVSNRNKYLGKIIYRE